MTGAGTGRFWEDLGMYGAWETGSLRGYGGMWAGSVRWCKN